MSELWGQGAGRYVKCLFGVFHFMWCILQCCNECVLDMF